MKVIIAGSRKLSLTAENKEKLKKIINNINVSEIVSGGATGADRLGELYSKEYSIPLKIFLPNWSKHGKAAGPLRNKQMAEYADVLILFYDGKSKGSTSMLNEARALNLQIHIIDI